MKTAIVVGVMAATVLMVGCAKKALNGSVTAPPSSKPAALSDGSNTWYLGGLTINGTNVPSTNVAIRVRM